MLGPAIPSFNRQSKVMLLAPHPDDESLGCSVVLQRAVRAGATVRVIYATNGENNPWPQRVSLRKWRLTEFDRARWGQLRREEATTALRVLGVGAGSVKFLGLPDQGLTDLLLSGCERTLHRLTRTISEWEPTDLFMPDISDTHPDHSAFGLMLRLVLEELGPAEKPLHIWSFIIHGRRNAFGSAVTQLRQTITETETKIKAIGCHQSQLRLSRRRFMAYAARPESFLPCDCTDGRCESTGFIDMEASSPNLEIRLSSRRKRLLSRRVTVLLLGRTNAGRLLCARIPLDPRYETLPMFDYGSGLLISRSLKQQHVGAGSLAISMALPPNTFSAKHPLYIKLHRPRIFFDEAGWTEARQPLVVRRLAPVSTAPNLLMATG